jgi:hypothetical protein
MSMSLSLNSFGERPGTRGSSRRARRNRVMRQPRFEGLEDRITLTANTWTGAAALASQDYSWSNAGNWSNGALQSGQDIVFPAAGPSTFIPTHAINNDLANMTFDSIEIEAPGYTIGGDAITLTASTGISTTYSSGVSTLSLPTNLAGGNVDVASGGELDIDGVISGSSGFSLSGGGILGGNGQVTGLTVQNSEVQPGILGVGSLSVLGGGTFYPTSTFSTSIDSSSVNSSLLASGSPTSRLELASPALNISIAAGFSPAPGSEFTIIQGNVSGTFNDLPDGANITSGGTTFRISYTTTGVVLTAVVPTTIQTSTANGASTSVFGQNVTFDATVSEAAGTPTGTVTFEDGTAVLGTEPLNASGVAMFTTANLTVGDHAITSVYSGDSKFSASTSPALDVTVNQANTSTTLASSANPSASGQVVTFTAHVVPVAPGGGGPTGSVGFFDGTTELSIVPLVGSFATFSSSLSLGSHSITAAYSGDADFDSSTSAAVSQNVDQSNSNTSVVSSQNPSVFGQSVTFTAQVAATAPGAGTPSGSVTFFDGTTELGALPLSGGTASFSTPDLTRGTHSISVVYSGDADFLASTSAVTTQDVTAASTQTTLVPTPSATAFGENVTFIAQVAAVAPGAGVPTGSVTFLDGTTELQTVALKAGTASISTSDLSLGSHSITAEYNGDGVDYLASTSSPSVELVGGTTVALATSISPSAFGQSVTFTATVTAAAPGSGVPAGSVTFMDGTTPLGTSAVGITGIASISTTKLTGGIHAITAMYSGNPVFAASTSNEIDQLVNEANTTTTLSLSPSDGQSTFGQSVTLTATVTGPQGTPTGTVNFEDGSTVLATVPVGASGIATFSTNALTVGAHVLAALYSGSDSAASSASSTQAFSVSPAATTTILTDSTSTPAAGLVTFTASVAAVAPGAGSPTGVVVFRDGSTVIGTAPVSAGQASLTVVLSGVGKAQVIGATYDGSESFGASASAGRTVTVVQAIPTVTLVATADFVGPTARGVTFTVFAQAKNAGGPLPTGSVTFEINHRALRTVRLVNGSASVFVSKRKATGQTFFVRYRGDTDYKAAASSKIHIRSKFFESTPAVKRAGV